MPRRIESPSSINTYKRCPRKYYYAYIKKLEALPNIHQVRGSIAHKVLEKFFDADVSKLTLDDFEPKLMMILQQILLAEWHLNEKEFERFGLSTEQKQWYFEETLLMLLNWLDTFSARVRTQKGSFPEIFKKLTPVREVEYVSEKLCVKGIIDAIENINNETRIMDYKTSNSFDENEHKLQLAIYSLLYHEKYNRLPDKAGIYFLKDRPKFIDVDFGLLEFAKKEIELIHKATESDNIENYPRSEILCKWQTGKCEYYDICMSEEDNKANAGGAK